MNYFMKYRNWDRFLEQPIPCTYTTLASVLRKPESQVRQIPPWVPIDEKGDAGVNHQSIKDVQRPLVSINVSRHTLSELDKTID